MNASDADEVIVNSSANAKAAIEEFRKRWNLPYTAAAGKQQQQALAALAPQVKEGMRRMYRSMIEAKPDFRDNLIAQKGEKAVAEFEQFIGMGGE